MKIENAIRRAFNRYGDRSTETRQHIPAPVKGLNTTDPISDMEKEYGTELVNMFPHDGRVSLRKGYAEYIDTGTGEPVHSLFTFRSGDTERAYACTGGKIIDISDPDAPVDKKTGQNSDVWHVAQAEILAVMVNGVDTPQQIDAAGDFSDATLTEKGAAKDSTFDNVNLYRILAYKGRMFFLEKNSARAWYTDAGTAVGELNKFNFNVVHSAGGNPIALGNITLDSGRGPDDLLAVFFDSGAVLLYSGTNPSDADSWGLVGQFNIGRLLGDRPLMQIGPDLVAMTADGIIPVLPFLQTGRARKDLEISRKISDLAREAIVENATNKGLGMIYYPGGSMVIFNIPDPGGSYQLVMNSQTMAWTVFEGMDALSWSLEGDDIYFGDRAGVVFKADTGRADNGGPIKRVHRLRIPISTRQTLKRSI